MELLVSLILIGLVSTIVLTNSNFLQKYGADQVHTYQDFITFLSEESALTKKNIAWFIGNDTQYAASFKNDKWHIINTATDFLPLIRLNTVFKDSRINSFTLNDERVDPFIVFYPSGKSSSGSIEFTQTENNFILKIDSYSKVTVATKNYYAK